MKSIKDLVESTRAHGKLEAEKNKLMKEILVEQGKTNKALERLCNINTEFIQTLTQFFAFEKKIHKETQDERKLREMRTKPTPHDLIY